VDYRCKPDNNLEVAGQILNKNLSKNKIRTCAVTDNKNKLNYAQSINTKFSDYTHTIF